MKTDNSSYKISRVAFRDRGKHSITIGQAELLVYSKTFTHNLQTRQKQQGVTLFIGLIFLIMLSLLGINAAQMSTLEERMSGNVRSRDLAFQAAEAALKHVEQNLATGQTIRTLMERLPDAGTTEKYRVTARGVGGDSSAVVILQTMLSY